MLSPTHARRFVGVARVAVGVSAWVAPRSAPKAFGIDSENTDGFIMRLFGCRDVLLAATLLGADRSQLRAVATVNATADTIDVVGELLEMRAGRMSTWAAISGVGGAALLAVLGASVAVSAETA